MDTKTNNRIEAKAARDEKVSRVWGPIFERYSSIAPRSTHRRPEDHAQAKIDAEAKRERRRGRNKRNAMRERAASSLPKGLGVSLIRSAYKPWKMAMILEGVRS